jgi:hypothetical protein
MHKQQMTRRNFIVSLLAGGACASLLLRQAASAFASTASASDIGGFLRAVAACREIGEAYLQQNPAERNKELLEQLVFSDFGKSRDSIQSDELKNYLFKRIELDFAEDKIILLNTWFLSATEARLYALAAL